jgi:hypothetical protein
VKGGLFIKNPREFRAVKRALRKLGVPFKAQAAPAKRRKPKRRSKKKSRARRRSRK